MSDSGLDFSQIEESQAIEGLRFLMNSPPWREIYMPTLERTCAKAYLLLKVEPETRQGRESDALLRARIAVLEQVMALGPRLIAEYDEQRAKREEQEAARESYAQRAEDGRMAPQ